MSSTNLFWIGIDWGDKEHAVHFFHPATDRHERFTVPHSPSGLDEVVQRIQAVDTIGGVAVEASRNLLMTKLPQAELPVYAINPKLSASWREAYSVSGAKSDGGDARMLAEGLWHHHGHLRTSSVARELMAELAQLCEDEMRFIQQRTALVQELQAMLKRYHPYMLVFFDDWTSPSAWDFLALFPAPEAVAKAPKKKICAFLAKCRIGMSPLWQARVDGRKQALDWPQDAAQIAALSVRAQTIIAMLKPLEKQLRQVSGVAPVTMQSGRKNSVKIRRACRKHWRNILHQFAQHSKKKSKWARTFYDMCKAYGDNHATALRKLAYKWLSIIYRMYQAKTHYNDQKHIEQLRKKNSPTYQYMVANGYC
jgi:transposase